MELNALLALEGTFNDQVAQATCTDKTHKNGCPAGEGLYRETNLPTVDDWVCKPCDDPAYNTENTFNADPDSTAECQYHKYWIDCPAELSTCDALTCVIGYQLTGANALEDADCTKCPAGMASALDAQDCTSCGDGTYNDGTSKAECDTCEAGKISRSAGHAFVFDGACSNGYEIEVQFDTSDPINSCANACLERLPSVGGNWADIDTNGGVKTFLLTTAQDKCYCEAYSTCGSVVSTTEYKSYAFGATECTTCSAGTYEENNECKPCAAGTYQDLTGQTSCKDCAAGTYSTTVGATSASVCTDCAAGTYSTTVGATSASVCTVCAAGTYQDLTGQTSCTDCADGTYQDLTGQTSCTDCAAGKYQQREYYNPTQDFSSTSSDPGWLTSGECEEYARMAGIKYRSTWYGNVIFGCVNRGSKGIYYNGYNGGFKCTSSNTLYKCVRLNRTSTVKTSIDACTDCLVGLYQDLTGQAVCTKCAAGTYQDLTGQTSCTDCAAGTYSTTVGATSACTECSTHQTSDAGATTCNGPYTLTEAGGYCNDYASVSQPVETVDGVVQASEIVGQTTGINTGTSLDNCAVFCRNWDYFIHESADSKCYCGHTGPKDTCNDWQSNTYNSYKVTKGDVVEETSGVGDFSLNAEECAAYGRSEGYTLKYSGSISTTSDAMVLTTGIELHGMQDLPIEDLVISSAQMCGAAMGQENWDTTGVYKRSPTQFIAYVDDGYYIKMILLEITTDRKIKAISTGYDSGPLDANDIEGHWARKNTRSISTTCIMETMVLKT